MSSTNMKQTNLSVMRETAVVVIEPSSFFAHHIDHVSAKGAKRCGSSSVALSDGLQTVLAFALALGTSMG